jgi:hypothetical protein
MSGEIVEHLRRQREGMLRKGEFAIVNRDDISGLLSVIDALRAERDEARREICDLVSNCTVDPREAIAKRYGWDCFEAKP